MSLTDKCHIAFVNLDERKDRLDHMRAQLDRIGLADTSRVRGLLPSEVKNDKTKVMENRTPGAIGCHYAQVGIMQAAIAQKKHAWVMEDDLIFCEDFNERLEYIDKWMAANEWDVFWLGASFHSPAFWHPVGPSGMQPNCSAGIGKDCEPTDDPRIIRTYGAFCTFAYIVNHNSLDKVLTMLDEHLHESIGIDWLFIKLQGKYRNKLKCFSFVPGCIKQMDSQSNIGNGITKWSGFLTINGNVQNSAYVYQERMEDFNPIGWQWR